MSVMVTIVVLNVLFAIVGLLIAVGIPVAGLFWQAREETSQVARRPAALGGLTGPRGAPRQPELATATLSAHSSDHDRAA